MTAAVPAAFDRLAPDYDSLWTDAPVGRLQRDAVWRRIHPFFQVGDRVLDLGCGTGEDAVWLTRLGARVTAIDASPEMVKRAQARGIDARVLAIEEISRIEARFEVVFSNFGALNCVADWKSLMPLVKPGGYAVLCIMGRFCLWETAWYLLTGQPRKAFRRWRGLHFHRALGIQLFYPGVASVRRMFASEFRLISITGIAVCVPPSYIRGLPASILRLLDRLDRWAGALPVLRSLADHRLLVFRRS
jgi:SAM-dependent methyltransferase